MTTMLEQAARQALKALEQWKLCCDPSEAGNWPDEDEAAIIALREALAEKAAQEPFDMDNHPPHRLCECRKCMEYFTPLPDCDAFAASGKPIAEQEPVAWLWVSEHGSERLEWEPVEDTSKWKSTPLYAAPARTKDLTDDEIRAVWLKVIDPDGGDEVMALARAVIAADREKNK